jgi:hypothetical protein
VMLDSIIEMGVPDMALGDDGSVNQFVPDLGTVWFSLVLQDRSGESDKKLVSFMYFHRVWVFVNDREQRFRMLDRYVGAGKDDEKLCNLILCGNIPFEYGQEMVDLNKGECHCWINCWMLNKEVGDEHLWFVPLSCAEDLVMKYKGLLWYFDDMMKNKFFSIGGGAK